MDTLHDHVIPDILLLIRDILLLIRDTLMLIRNTLMLIRDTTLLIRDPLLLVRDTLLLIVTRICHSLPSTSTNDKYASRTSDAPTSHLHLYS